MRVKGRYVVFLCVPGGVCRVWSVLVAGQCQICRGVGSLSLYPGGSGLVCCWWLCGEGGQAGYGERARG